MAEFVQQRQVLLLLLLLLHILSILLKFKVIRLQARCGPEVG